MESWILVFRISLDLDSGFVTRDSWILGRSGGARDPAEVVRERRQRLRHRLRRRLGHAMGRVRHSQTCVICALCAPLGADFAAGVGHPARAGAPWVGFSGLEVLRDHALDDMPSPMVSETRFTPQIPGSPAAHVPCRCSRSCAWDGIVML